MRQMGTINEIAIHENATPLLAFYCVVISTYSHIIS